MKKTIAIALGLIAFALPFFLNLEGLPIEGRITLSLFLLAAVFWLLEPIPIYATSMLVIFGQVLMLSNQSLLLRWGVFEGSDYVNPPYGDFYASLANPIIILFLGGFCLAAAAVRCGLDKNLTRILLKPFGTRPSRVVLGVMLITGVLSGFMSNTATTAMMITVVAPIVASLSPDDPFRRLIVLAIPVSANIGGLLTPIGTPPNAIALAALSEQGIQISFTQWMILAAPLVILMLAAGWFLLVRLFPPQAKSFEIDISSRFQTNFSAITTYIVFGLTVVLWITEELHGIPANVVAFLPIAALPAMGVLGKSDIRGFAWEVLWLMAGGVSLGIAMRTTGLAEWMVQSVDWSGMGLIVTVGSFTLVAYLLANFVSNTVTAALMVPLAVGLALSPEADTPTKAILVITVAVVVSFSMILPVSTPPNAIAMASGHITTPNLMRIGIPVGIVGLVLTLLLSFFYWPLLPL